ncbi:hypothetical protein [Pectinatus haikarae]|uniref:Peptidase n=1 Tax=Pectinatus haikarae TaxID=349096 RepID=A0ABT9Y935_9FIRM|nr:hypothetical protein [Pectinatus haikarae]MDQ0204355.1 putative peptidase [Pectinatus haikarae]
MKNEIKKILLKIFPAILLTFFTPNLSHAAISPINISADDAIIGVNTYGFVDLEGAKPSAIIVEYNQSIDAATVHKDTFKINDYVTMQEQEYGFDQSIERDGDDIQGNEGQITKVYVNNAPAPSKTGGTKYGRYAIIELNNTYMLKGQNLPYTTSMMAGVVQKNDITGEKGLITDSKQEFKNYTMTQKQDDQGRMRAVITTDKSHIILPEFGPESGWTIHYIGQNAFKATHCYSEYTGKYEDFELPYSIYVPDEATLNNYKGHISLVVHMEHAGANDMDPMAAITSSKAAVKLSEATVQSKNPAIIVVPQIENNRRSTNDVVASSEANTAVWELLDHILEKYKGYIDTNRIYGTGQSMGGMLLLNMAAQRDNFFAGLALVGAQWSNSYDKPFQNNGAPARSPENDTISFNGFGLDKENYQNWYYMISDDNILVSTCADDPMGIGEWRALSDYYAAAGVKIAYDEWDPYLSLEKQNEREKNLTQHQNNSPGTGINWVTFTRGNHMSTWKYGYQLDYPFTWLFAQNRKTELRRGKIAQLKNKWLGRDSDGKVKIGSGTAHLNSAQFTPDGASDIYAEGWTSDSVRKKLKDTAPTDIQK